MRLYGTGRCQGGCTGRVDAREAVQGRTDVQEAVQGRTDVQEAVYGGPGPCIWLYMEVQDPVYRAMEPYWTLIWPKWTLNGPYIALNDPIYGHMALYVPYMAL